MIIVPKQCRMAREALDWKQKDLAKNAKVAIDTISSFERERFSDNSYYESARPFA